MPKPFPDPNISESHHLFQYANTVTNSYFATIFMATCGIVLFLLLKAKGNKTSDSMALASLLTLVINSFIWAMGLLPGRYLVLLLLITITSTIWSIFER